MNRCLLFSRALALLALTGSLLLAAPALAQSSPRQFPPAALRGMLEITSYPEALLNGVPARLSPGARLKDANNMLVLPATLTGQRLLVNYVRDPQGLLHEVWLLTPQEAQEKRAGMEPNYRFASDADTPKRDDGKTPFNQLPVYRRQ